MLSPPEGDPDGEGENVVEDECPPDKTHHLEDPQLSPAGELLLDKTLETIFGAGATQLAEEFEGEKTVAHNISNSSSDVDKDNELSPIDVSTPDRSNSSKKRFRVGNITSVSGESSVKAKIEDVSDGDLDAKKQRTGSVGDKDGNVEQSAETSLVSSEAGSGLDAPNDQEKTPVPGC